MSGGQSVAAAGQFALVRGWDHGFLNGDVVEVVKTTAKLVIGQSGGWRPRQYRSDNVIAAFDSKADAERLRDTLAGVRGERDRRIRAAHEAAEEAARAVIARTKTGEPV